MSRDTQPESFAHCALFYRQRLRERGVIIGPYRSTWDGVMAYFQASCDSRCYRVTEYC